MQHISGTHLKPAFVEHLRKVWGEEPYSESMPLKPTTDNAELVIAVDILASSYPIGPPDFLYRVPYSEVKGIIEDLRIDTPFAPALILAAFGAINQANVRKIQPMVNRG